MDRTGERKMGRTISRREFIRYSGIGAGLAITRIGRAAQQSGKRPNLVIVFPDQMRGQALGFLKEDPVVTPHLDRFAAQGLVLPRAVSNYPVCSPFRAMFMTGKYPHANGVLSNCTSKTEPFGCELRRTDRCWSDVLKDRGYSLGYIGKWHLDSPRKPYVDCKNNRGEPKWNEWCPPDRRHGFDYWHAYGTYDYHMNPMYWATDVGRDGFHFAKKWGPEYEADLAIKFIERNKDRPFALVVSMNPPHTPYNQFPPKYLEPYKGKKPEDLLVRPNVDKTGKTKMSRLALGQTKNYFGNVTGVDEQFGRILKGLDDAGVAGNTIVLFTSDHGNCVGTHNQVTKNNPFEESMRIPFIVRWPGRIKARSDDLLMSVPDIYPTLLDLMGLKADIPEEVQGTSRAAYFLTGEGERPSSQLYLKIPYNKPDHGHRGVRTLQHKLVYNAVPGKKMTVKLYDLKKDPCEMSDIAAKQPALVEKLTEQELRPWLEKNKDPWIRHLKG
jgi:arylsulfatase A-like enzyme